MMQLAAATDRKVKAKTADAETALVVAKEELKELEELRKLRRLSSTSVSRTRMPPLSGSIRRGMQRSKVDFPAPLAPISATTLLGAISKEIPENTGFPGPKDLLRPLTEMTAGSPEPAATSRC